MKKITESPMIAMAIITTILVVTYIGYNKIQKEVEAKSMEATAFINESRQDWATSEEAIKMPPTEYFFQRLSGATEVGTAYVWANSGPSLWGDRWMTTVAPTPKRENIINQPTTKREYGLAVKGKWSNADRFGSQRVEVAPGHEITEGEEVAVFEDEEGRFIIPSLLELDVASTK